MLKNTQINCLATRKIATALGELNEQVVYVGGAVVSLYIDDPAAEDVRPTKDVDISLEIVSLGHLESLREQLSHKGFTQSHEDKVVCRFRLEDIKVDVMSTKSIGWAPGNRWFESGFQQSFVYDLDGLPIRLLPLPYYMAAKFDAFHDRGRRDPRTSHDFEDIVYLLNHVSDIREKIVKAEMAVRNYLQEIFVKILNDDLMQEAIIANLFNDYDAEQFSKIINILEETTHGIH